MGIDSIKDPFLGASDKEGPNPWHGGEGGGCTIM